VEDDELREEEKAVAAGAPPRLRPNNDPDAAARPAQPRSAYVNPSPRQGPRQQALGECRRYLSFPFSPAAGVSHGPPKNPP
jgi:hypothetical protein